jgi:AraC-like DNA-binding protein
MRATVTAGAVTRAARTRGPADSWEIVTYTPVRWLRPYVRGLYGYAERTPGPLRRRELPSGGITVILNLGPTLYVRNPGAAAGDRFTSFVAGLHETYAITETSGAQAGIQLNLSPLGARVLFGTPMNELAHRTLPLEDLLGGDVERLLDETAAAPDWETRTALVEAYVEARLAGAKPPTREIAWACRRIEETAGTVKIAELTAILGWSRKRMGERFRDAVGLPPKSFARLLRFERAVAQLRAGAIGWARLAQSCGYYDQAHLIREFREFSGFPPGEFVRRMLPENGGLADA